MGHDPSELETRIARCERAVFGDDDSSQGLSARMKVQEMHSAEYREDFKLIKRLVVTAILVGLLNLIINRPASTHAPTQSTSVITGDATDAANAEAAKAEAAAQARGYYLTSDIARKWGKSAKTITDWIAARRFIPAPIQHGREYHFDLDTIETNSNTAAISREPPLSAADHCGTEPQ